MKLNDPTLFCADALVGGNWIAADGPDGIAVTNPADGSVIATVPSLSEADIQGAIAAAKAVRADWAARPARQRAALLRRWHDLIVENADDLAQILTVEQGKPLAEAKGEILSNAAYLEWFAEEGKRIYGEVVPSPAPDRRVIVLKQPIGICAAITPWNFPNGMITRKAGPALAAGCPIIVKPASQTPLSALSLAVLAERAGLPAGVFQVVTGKASMIGHVFCKSPDIAKISFTGSTEVGRWLIRESADDIKKLSLELGGNAPFLVFEDADLDAAVEGAMIAKFRNSGQTCVCANRIYVHENIVEAFAKRLAKAASELKLGSGTQPCVEQGPLIDMAAVDKIEAHIADALDRGARLLTGGQRHALGGSWFEPTVMVDVSSDALVAREETFAPLAPIISFSTEAEAIALANDSEFGLAAYFYSRDLARVFRVAEALETGIVGINTGMIANEAAPFGGIKQSGLGREGSRHGIEDYVEMKYLCIAGL
ncbi:NAD-dependent succinate-semialdehyde dehydrogenase [Paracoccus seriniphilus]|uniref:Succinate semialdehyde dehydrogenase n=1 Tax=Paracoccus seriniphilus TaxID=184748 RepID=A0A239PTB5_9RHOB|nr:NAD-dependent succinate-semialdehyde dehydrogenase [Paracoccus seriniphilus]WCR16429.1 NAD-dependent succinate-semialdehyde dehydrogenase [Paracoccus seriniphilus]SNT73534.1 succinate semialdehyde dehydrogenase [Paracoccus seriniphilus]